MKPGPRMVSSTTRQDTLWRCRMAQCSHSSGVNQVGLRRSLSGSNSSRSGVAPGYPFGSAGSRESPAATHCARLIMKAGSTTSLDSAALRDGKGFDDRTGFLGGTSSARSLVGSSGSISVAFAVRLAGGQSLTGTLILKVPTRPERAGR